MTTIPRDLLVAKGTIDALLHLEHHTDTATTAELSDAMDVSKGTARERLSNLDDAGLVDATAELRNGTPTRVHEVTREGAEVASKLSQLLSNVHTETESGDSDDE